MGLLRHNEESRPLVANVTPLSAAALLKGENSQPIYSNGYINEDSYIDSKFGDSCRQSLTAIPMLDNVNLNDNSEFNLKKRYLRETSSGRFRREKERSNCNCNHLICSQLQSQDLCQSPACEQCSSRRSSSRSGHAGSKSAQQQLGEYAQPRAGGGGGVGYGAKGCLLVSGGHLA